ncbi:MAG TPA: bifunctional adenosylcobinamide kinase/adenosylcobinamide-phosphate guanylyltransferase [Rhodocyclaceae bacterium]|nr:bifunctional adenosylcobinamide kinase/adenosylcobinamide-phosphate guanylyltransferase [Rhodocyclaceae bacterium]
MMIELILGGARSGKSALAEQKAIASGLTVTYVATANPVDMVEDSEMLARIAQHRAQRPAEWLVVEEPLYLATLLKSLAAPEKLLLVDCLTLWLSNLLYKDAVLKETQALLDVLPTLPGHVILVSNEVGMGIVPLGELTRRYVDEAGRLHQKVAAQADRVTFVAAGLPLVLKG